jgi:hypothetical protein
MEGCAVEVQCMHCVWIWQIKTHSVCSGRMQTCGRAAPGQVMQTCGRAAPGQVRAHLSTCLMRFIVSLTCGKEAQRLAIARLATDPTASEQNH